MFIRQIGLRNLLSFGPDGHELELKSLNVLIGPNGAGKSNLIEAISLLRAAPRDLPTPVREGGGVQAWLWKGDSPASAARMAVVVEPRDSTEPSLLETEAGHLQEMPRHGTSLSLFETEAGHLQEMPPPGTALSLFEAEADLLEEMPPPGTLPSLRYGFEFAASGQRFDLTNEALATEHPFPGHTRPYVYFAYQDGRPVLNYRDSNGRNGQRQLRPEDVKSNQSILAQRKDPDRFPEITYLGEKFSQIRLYREWAFGRNTPARLPQKADLPNDFLAEDGRNLGLVLNRLRRTPKDKNRLLEALREIYEGIIDFEVSIEGGTVQVFLQEGNVTVPATRLSDGTLRYLSLLTILCHPKPPPVLCLEEPELGLHPDMMPALGALLKEASKRCQLIVTTHSDVLVDSLTENAECVIVCDKQDGQTHMKRFDALGLTHWLEQYRLGELWRSGELGGNRW